MENLLYLLSACLLITGLKMLGSPKTAVRGNAIGAVGMLIAAGVALLLSRDAGGVPLEISRGALIAIGVGLAAGTLVGIIASQKVQMTAMPQMVALFNGLGGAASALVAAIDLFNKGAVDVPVAPELTLSIPAALSVLIGGVTLTGSAIAFAKLQGLIGGRPLVYPLQKPLNLLLLLGAIASCCWLAAEPLDPTPLYCLAGIAAILGVLSVLPIGGAAMPVVISLLNSYSGLAASAAGFVLGNNILIIAGSLVGASGLILTKIMCKAMNRSLANVLFGAFGKAPEGAGEAPATASGGTVKSGSPDDAAMILDSAGLVIIVPGYGMAVAQAQHATREMADLLQKNNCEVKYAIHPVAGRMPGHMNVLLAEADVPYDQLYDMDQINSEFSQADVALVIGANDVTNPAAKTDPSSPIYGMPILVVDFAQTLVVEKWSLSP
ncbi:MAG: NAD(P)(+) transhydrogenase (Re/Si-specific) subunit beta [Planctomycetes bacterium]|nr:NAD(P)(+) transhydrogenase (Re/Si-specific) subunit beta [Planctomycetota bacterium]